MKPTDAQLRVLRHLGWAGDTPPSRASASEAIINLKGKRLMADFKPRRTETPRASMHRELAALRKIGYEGRARISSSPIILPASRRVAQIGNSGPKGGLAPDR